MCVAVLANGSEHVLFAGLILFKIKECSHHPKSKSDHLIEREEDEGK